MDKKYELELLTPAQRELEEIGRVHLEIVGPLSARKITIPPTDCYKYEHRQHISDVY